MLDATFHLLLKSHVFTYQKCTFTIPLLVPLCVIAISLAMTLFTYRALTRRESYERIYKEAACVILKLLVMQLSAQSVLGATIRAVGGGTIIPFRLTTALDSFRHT